MKIQIINKSKHSLPQYATPLSAGMDLRANLEKPIVLKPLQRCLCLPDCILHCPKGMKHCDSFAKRSGIEKGGYFA